MDLAVCPGSSYYTNTTTLLAVLRILSVCVCHLKSFVMLLICCRQLLIGHGVVPFHVVVSDVHPRTFINIEIRLRLVCPLNNFIDFFLCSSVMYRVSISVAKFSIICKF